MKIAVNGNLIDIESIYKISKIEKVEEDYYDDEVYYCDPITFSDKIYLQFIITLYGNVSIEVRIYSYTSCNEVRKQCKIYKPGQKEPVIVNNYNGTLKQCEESDIYQSQLKKITKIRQDILNLQANNQKNLLKFSTETEDE